MDNKYDLIIIGSGAAAFAAALKASEIDVKVAMIERGTIGGTCVNVGCIPSKNLLHAARRFYECKSDSTKLDFKKVIDEKDELVLSLRKAKYIDVLDSMPNITFFKGSAAFVSENEVQVDGKKLYGEKFIIATGSSTYIPPIKGIDEINYLTHIEALSLKEKPNSMVVIGGGPLGLEFAQMYARFGTKVTLLEVFQE